MGREATISVCDQSLLSVPILVVDLEMTGLDLENDRICEVALIRQEPDGSLSSYESLIRPDAPMSEGAAAVHGLQIEDLSDSPGFDEVSSVVNSMLDGAVLVGHHVAIDWYFLGRELAEAGCEFQEPVLMDTLEMSRRLFAFPKNNLASVCAYLGVELGDAHRAMPDARATYEVFLKMIELTDPDHDLSVSEWSHLIRMLAPRSSLREFQQKLLREAFRKKVSVMIDYLSTSHPLDGVIQREVDIWRLRLPKIQGWCHLRGDERVFRVDRIRKVKRGERGYVVPKFKRRV